MTYDSIRDDLEHIHRLEVVNLTTVEGHIFVSLNDVNLAVIARSCMTSRLKYKGSRIEFARDECTDPLPPITRKPAPKPVPQATQTKRDTSISNRFNLLSLDGLQEGESDGSDSD